MENKVFDVKKYAGTARAVVAEGIVMLRNEGRVLPLGEGEKIALFGRGQFHYYKSGTGSGGMVNTSYVTGVREALEGSSFVLNEKLKAVYEEWLKAHPFDAGAGWAGEPWFQKEMPLTEELVRSARKESDTAVIVIGRTAGEDQDNKAEAGSYLLTADEEDMLRLVCGVFERTVVLLNVGNIIDMKWVERDQPAAVLYVWQGGQEGGNGVLDVLSGKVSPSGKLTDTIAYDIADYPSSSNHGNESRNIYQEDIYVGYRYFETFARDKVLYPFGFGLSYTDFAVEASVAEAAAADSRAEAVMPGGEAADSPAAAAVSEGKAACCQARTATSEKGLEGSRTEMPTSEKGLEGSRAEEPASGRAAGCHAEDGKKGFAEGITIFAKVTNTGDVAGKEVIQVYCQAPQGVLGKPARSLCGFAKTKELAPGQSQTLRIPVSGYTCASYDDSGATGHKACWVLEVGTYVFHVGTDVRNASPAGSLTLDDTIVLKEAEEACAPVTAFQRMKPEALAEDGYRVSYEDVPLRTQDPGVRRRERLPEENCDRKEAADCSVESVKGTAGSTMENSGGMADGTVENVKGTAGCTVESVKGAAGCTVENSKEAACTGDRGWRLADVEAGKVSMRDFLAQLTDEDLCCIVRGEGMCSPKVTAGTAGAFGGVTDRLAGYGIPIACCADGPSGIRMDCGSTAFAMPNGACLASTFNEALSEELFEWEGLELRKNKIDTLLGPGINLHRNPLNGRNFEYFSEDPFVTGKMAAAQLRAMGRYDVTGTIKHFACNSQEYKRNEVEAVVSERALRELYLKGFEIAVTEGGAYSIMTSYNPINGFWSASNYDMLTTILRGEWKYDGIVMTDWWAKANDEGHAGKVENTAAMVRAQNDLFMVVANAGENSQKDNSMESLKKGTVTRGEYLRSAANICRFLLRTPAYQRMLGRKSELDTQLEAIAAQEMESFGELVRIAVTEGTCCLPVEQIATGKGSSVTFELNIRERGIYRLELTCRVAGQGSLAQIPLTLSQDRQIVKTISLTGEDKEWRTEEIRLNPSFHNTTFLKFFFGQGGMEIKEARLVLEESMEAQYRAEKETAEETD